MEHETRARDAWDMMHVRLIRARRNQVGCWTQDRGSCITYRQAARFERSSHVAEVSNRLSCPALRKSLLSSTASGSTLQRLSDRNERLA